MGNFSFIFCFYKQSCQSIINFLERRKLNKKILELNIAISQKQTLQKQTELVKRSLLT